MPQHNTTSQQIQARADKKAEFLAAIVAAVEAPAADALLARKHKFNQVCKFIQTPSY